jgi:Zn-dependent protease
MESSPQWLPPQPAPFEPATEPAVPPPYEERREPLLKRVGGAVAVLVALLAKFAKVAFIALKSAKFLTTSATMLVSVAAYAFIWGWPFAVGFVALLFVHEFGHYLQMRREGINPGRIVFVPFMGAVIGARSLGGNALAEARVGLAGPVLGSLGALVVALVGQALHSDLLLALAFTGFFLNLFNLVPVVPLDGGRAMAAMAPWMWFLGLGAMVTLMLLRPNPIMIVIVLFGTMETYRRWKTRKQGLEGNAAYYAVRPRDRFLVGTVYVALIIALAVGMDLTHIARTFADV